MSIQEYAVDPDHRTGFAIDEVVGRDRVPTVSPWASVGRASIQFLEALDRTDQHLAGQ